METLQGLAGSVVFMDDILIYGDTVEKPDLRLEKVECRGGNPYKQQQIGRNQGGDCIRCQSAVGQKIHTHRVARTREQCAHKHKSICSSEVRTVRAQWPYPQRKQDHCATADERGRPTKDLRRTPGPS